MTLSHLAHAEETLGCAKQKCLACTAYSLPNNGPTSEVVQDWRPLISSLKKVPAPAPLETIAKTE